MKVFLIVFFCIQQTDLELDKTCVTEIQEESYNNISGCILGLSNIQYKVREIPNLYTTGFCTTKDIESA